MQLLPLTATVMPFTTTSIYLEDAFQAQYPAAQVRLLIFLKVLNHLFLASQGFTYPIVNFQDLKILLKHHPLVPCSLRSLYSNQAPFFSTRPASIPASTRLLTQEIPLPKTMSYSSERRPRLPGLNESWMFRYF